MPLRFRKLPALLLLLVLAACSRPAEFESKSTEVEDFRKDFGIDPGQPFDLPSGSKVMFFGDSLTAGGVKEGGYVTLFGDAIDTLYPDRDIQVLGSGVVGDKVSDLSSRLRKDVLAKKPTHVVIFVGVNDVASTGQSRVSLNAGAEAYRMGLTKLVTNITATGAKVVICTPGVIGEDIEQGTLTNYGLELYASKARTVAREMETGLCDIRSDFSQYLSTRNRSSKRTGILTVDGLHLNAAGNRLVARTMLRAFTGSGTLPPTPFVAPTVSPRPRPPLPVPSATRRATKSPNLEPAQASTTPEETEPPASSPSAVPPSSPPAVTKPSPIVVRTPDGFPFESPEPSPSPEN